VKIGSVKAVLSLWREGLVFTLFSVWLSIWVKLGLEDVQKICRVMLSATKSAQGEPCFSYDRKMKLHFRKNVKNALI
jgi:hypothetical protein